MANENFPAIRDDFATNEASPADVPTPLQGFEVFSFTKGPERFDM